MVRNYGFEYEGKSGDTIDDSVLFCGAWEKDFAFFMRDYLERRANKNAVFIDVGCNAGHHSLFLSRYVKQIHAFDPFLPVVERFRKMIQRNGFANIVVHRGSEGALASDGRLAALDLVTLEDDRGAIPPYDAVVIVGRSLRRARPDVVAALGELDGRIPVEQMRASNLAVDLIYTFLNPKIEL